MDVSQPPPSMLMAPSAFATNIAMLPPPTNSGQHYRHFHGHHGPGKQGFHNFKPFSVGGFQRPFAMSQDDFDGKRLRKSVMRKTVDYNASIVKSLEARLWQRDYRDRHALQPESIYVPQLLPPTSYIDNPSNAVTTRFVKTATNKMRCPIFTLAWTPEGRRLVTGASSGEFTLWNGLTFNFETILQAHDVSVRTMVWSHNDSWMVTGDHNGYVKYWQSNMNNVKMYQAHKEAIRGISFSPTDNKFVSCSDDGTLRIWDFLRCQEERVLRGHGADVKCVHWHPQKGLIVSGSKDNQQPIKLWDPKSGSALATLHAHKSTVMDLKWNDNGNWLVTASRDHLLKLFDIRNLREEVQVFRGHKKEASSVTWHPVHEGLFCSGGSDGSILFWNVGTDKEIGGVETAHDSIVWTLAWHPLGHILCSGSNDHTIKFWTRNRPGDLMRDKYNLNTLPASLAALDECEYDDAIIPGMGPEDKVEFTESLTADKGFIPGLDLDPNKLAADRDKEKKVPYSKPIPRNFQAQWAGAKRPAEDGFIAGSNSSSIVGNNGISAIDEPGNRDTKELSNNNGLTQQQISENTIESMLASGMLTSLDPQTIIGILVYGRFIRVHTDSRLMLAVRQGSDYLNKYIDAGKLEELRDVLPMNEDSRSLSPTLECRETSPPPKKSRFEPRQHNAQPVFVRELLNLKKPFLPCLLSMKMQQQQQQVLTNQDCADERVNDVSSSVEQQNHLSPWSGNVSPWTNNNSSNSNSSVTNQNGYNNNSTSGTGNESFPEHEQYQKNTNSNQNNNNNGSSNDSSRRRRNTGGSSSSSGSRNRTRNRRF